MADRRTQYHTNGAAAYDKLEQETLTPENLTAVMEELGF